jgi:hypothetical protein
MGLLDDAIREHLELKRLRGADPGEVAREQREALEPVVSRPPGGDVEKDGRPEDSGGGGDPAAGDAPAGEPAAEGSPQDGPPEASAGFSTVGEETAELDMQSVLDQDDDAPEAHSPSGPAAARPARGASPASLEEDALEWEIPPRSDAADGAHGSSASPEERDGGESSEPPEQVPGQERLSFE